MDSQKATVPGRMYELDWLRVIVTINLIPFHVAWMMTSVPGFSFIERGTTAWNILNGFVWFVSPLHMYLLLLVAGTSTFLSMRSRSPGQYVSERIKRLLVPLLTFMIFLFPVLGYFWPPAQYAIGLSYLKQFWPWCLSTTFYSPVTGGPNWGHMWFAAYLFIYSLVFLPLLLRIRAGRCVIVEPITRFLTGGKGRIFLVGIPIALTFAVLSPIWPFFRNNLYSDWGYFTYNLTAFLLGFVIASDSRWMKAFKRHAPAALILGLVFSAAKMYMMYVPGTVCSRLQPEICPVFTDSRIQHVVLGHCHSQHRGHETVIHKQVPRVLQQDLLPVLHLPPRGDLGGGVFHHKDETRDHTRVSLSLCRFIHHLRDLL